MADVKSTVRLAIDFLGDVVEGAEGIRVEEAERTGGDWFVTISYLAPPDGPLAGLQMMSPLRVYRRFHVVDGVVRSMKIRETEDA